MSDEEKARILDWLCANALEVRFLPPRWVPIHWHAATAGPLAEFLLTYMPEDE
jgi:hypothetical protein